MENGIKNKEEKEKKSSSIKKKFNKVLNLMRLSGKCFMDFRIHLFSRIKKNIIIIIY